MLIDCDACQVRGPACGDCVVTVLLGSPPQDVRLDPEERRALDVLAASGLVPPLRLVVMGAPTSVDHECGGSDGANGSGGLDRLEDGVVLARRHAPRRRSAG